VRLDTIFELMFYVNSIEHRFETASSR